MEVSISLRHVEEKKVKYVGCRKEKRKKGAKKANKRQSAEGRRTTYVRPSLNHMDTSHEAMGQRKGNTRELNPWCRRER
jgi:hypothetical protein